jgi:AraC-like DNA-binding protein
MLNQYIQEIKNALSDVGEGSCVERSHTDWQGNGTQHTYALPQGKGKKESWTVMPGVTITFMDYLAQGVVCEHEASGNLLEINFCRYGRIGWNMKNGSAIYLGSGDFSIHTQALCAGSEMTLPSGHFEGLCICIDLDIFDQAPPELLNGTGITGKILRDKSCSTRGFSVLIGSENTDPIFSGFYGIETQVRRLGFTIKVLELLLYLSDKNDASAGDLKQYQAEQVEIIRGIHDYLMQNMSKRFTIEELAEKFSMNPTTMKAIFKAVYGDSLAAHMKEHRMERAAALLRTTSDSVAQISQAVGYTSQSKFSTAF